MTQWTNKDEAAGSPKWGPALVNKPANTTNQTALFGNTTPNAFVAGQTVGVFAVDAAETAAESAVAHAGWVMRKAGTGGRAGRVQYETLVAMHAITTDAEDTVLPDIKLSWTTQPANMSVASPAPASFTADAKSTPTGASVVYAWSADSGSGYTALVNGGNISGANTATLTLAASTGLNGVKYRVTAASAGANTITSSAATLTVTA